MSPQKLVRVLFGLGILILGIGALVFFAYFPHQASGGCFAYGDFQGGLPCTEGSLRATMLGAAVAGVGFLVVLVPIIAWGVRLGQALGRSDRA